jgi:L-lysine exporter family protein LysE/ArgO
MALDFLFNRLFTPDPTAFTATALNAGLQGFVLSFSLIVAIGAQNAFVLRQALRREHVGLIVAVCAAADALLIAAGVAGMAQLIGERPALARGLAAAGAGFLAVYGLRALQRARHPSRLLPTEGRSQSRREALLALAGFTLLNPHVYLDTVLLVGSVGAQQPEAWARAAFVGGAALASASWFALLGYGAQRLAGWFAKPSAWQALDVLIGLTMLGLAAQLLPRVFGNA